MIFSNQVVKRVAEVVWVSPDANYPFSYPHGTVTQTYRVIAKT